MDHFSRSDRLEFWLNGSRPWIRVRVGYREVVREYIKIIQFRCLNLSTPDRLWGGQNRHEYVKWQSHGDGSSVQSQLSVPVSGSPERPVYNLPLQEPIFRSN